MTTTPPDSGSHGVDVPKKRGLGWLWILLAVLLVALLAWWPANAGDVYVQADELSMSS